MKSLTIQGLWWLPDTPEDRITGTLTFDQIDGGSLNVVGSLARMQNGQIGANAECAVIHGVTTTGKPVTLLKALVTRRNFLDFEFATEAWLVHTIAIGAHFFSDNDALFNRSWVRFDGIAQWLALNPFAEKHCFETLSTTVTIRKPPRLQLGTIPGATLYADLSIQSSRDGDENWTSTSESWIAVDADEPQPLQWHFVATSNVRSLAELLYGRSLHLTKLQVELPKDPNADGTKQSAQVDIYAQLIGGDDALPPIKRPPMLTAPELLKFQPNALAHWFAQYEKFSPALHLLSAVAPDRPMFSSVRFLLVLQAIEAFHRQAFPGTIAKIEEYNALVAALTSAIPADTPPALRDKLTGTLTWLNEPSLRQRLRALIDFARDARDDVMPAYTKEFINSVVATRNHETHHGERPSNFLEGFDMVWATRRLIILMHVVFLRQIGLSNDTIESMINRNQEYTKLWTTEDVL